MRSAKTLAGIAMEEFVEEMMVFEVMIGLMRLIVRVILISGIVIHRKKVSLLQTFTKEVSLSVYPPDRRN